MKKQLALLFDWQAGKPKKRGAIAPQTLKLRENHVSKHPYGQASQSAG